MNSYLRQGSYFRANSQMLTLYFVLLLSVDPQNLSIIDLVMDNIKAVVSVTIGILKITFLIETVAYQSDCPFQIAKY